MGCGFKKRLKRADGGLIRGPGTGVSDDIDMTMPDGAYVMPADTTAQLGPEQLAQIGQQPGGFAPQGAVPAVPNAGAVDPMQQMPQQPMQQSMQPMQQQMPQQGAGEVPVSVSDGEFAMPPEQVHAVGVQTLDNLRHLTHEPVQGVPEHAGPKPRQAFADGGSVEDKRRRRLREQQSGQAQAPRAAAQPAGFYVDQSGRTTGQLPSQSREMVPAGPRTSAGVPATAPQYNYPSRPQDFYVDQSGRATGQMPSQSRGLTPAGPRTSAGVPAVAPQYNPSTMPAVAPQHNRAPAPTSPNYYVDQSGRTTAQMPSQSRQMAPTAQGFAPQGAPTLNATPTGGPRGAGLDYEGRARAMHGRARDSAGWQAERAAQDQRFQNAQQPQQSQPSRRQTRQRGPGSTAGRLLGPAGAVLTAAPEVGAVGEVARDPQSTRLDTATQAAEGVGRTAATGAGAMAGAKGGAALGALGGPVSWATIPAGGFIGGVAGGIAGYRGADAAIRAGREAVGVDPSSPVDRTRARQQPDMPPELPMPDEQSPDMSNNITREGNRFSGGNITSGFTVNGRPSSEADPLWYHADDPVDALDRNQRAKQQLFANTPEFQEGDLQGGRRSGGAGGQAGVGAQGAPGGFQSADAGGGGARGPQLRVIRDTSRPLTNEDILRNRQRARERGMDLQERQQTDDVALRREAQGFQRQIAQAQHQAEQAQRMQGMQQEQRMERLRQMYEQAGTDEERNQIAVAMRDLQGQARPALQIARSDRLADPNDPLSQTLTESYIIDPTTQQVRPVTGTGQGQRPTPPQQHISALLQYRDNPEVVQWFDDQYGPGAALRYGAQ